MIRSALPCIALLALAGCSSFHRTVSVRVTTNGTDRLYSQIRMDTHRAEFRCLASVTGACHYVVYARPCQDREACTTGMLHRFEVPAGKRTLDASLPSGYVACVSQDPAEAGNACPRLR